MANASAKNRVKANASILNQLRWIMMASAACFVVIRVWIRRVRTWRSLLEFSVLLVIDLVGYVALLFFARPTRDGRTGEVVDGGADLSDGSLELVQDVIYVTSLTLVLVSVFPKAWWIMMVIPAYGGYSQLAARSDGSAEVAVPEAVATNRRERRQLAKESARVAKKK